eukprot:TRINITY_DN8320_c0_g2_i1.p1 TRINITY_DN8320_c0_g2~~TRINITY_DN8320_c0_g2_i1.p1  ORF type:complete len:481 (-),score=122.02 TRINITY_DN8320_c0_g2_i1:242-1552(-)
MDSVAHLIESPIIYDESQAKAASARDINLRSPVLKAKFEGLEQMRKFGARAITVHGLYVLLGEGETLEKMRASIDESTLGQYCDGKSFRIVFAPFGKKNTHEMQQKVFDVLADLPMWDSGSVSMTNPDREYHVHIDYGRNTAKDHPPRYFYFTLKVCDGNAHLIDKFAVTKRSYIGTTSMDSELSLLQANQALARENTLVLDPFAGTGSLIIACALFGSHSMGGDIDRRMFDGYGDEKNVKSNFAGFGLKDQLLDIVVTDNAHSSWVPRPFLDAIVGDPPYGVRAGARKIGMKNKTKKRRELRPERRDESEVHTPQCIAYAVSDVLRDLLEEAAKNLILGGRLVYWLPTTNEYTEEDLPLHPCFEMIANSEQPLTMKWRRRLITMIKIREYHSDLKKTMPESAYGQKRALAAHDTIKEYFHPHMADQIQQDRLSKK